MTNPAVGDRVKWLSDPDAKGPHRFTFAVLLKHGDPTSEVRTPEGDVRHIATDSLIKIPGRHLGRR